VGFKQLFIEKKREILERWIRLIRETCPADGLEAAEQGKDPFVNPVGHTITREIGALCEGLLQGKEVDELSGHLEKIIQIRSVQDLSPSRAVLFVSLFKKAVRDEIEWNGNQQATEEWLEFNARIDQLSLMAFDLYTKYRERIYEIRIGEIKKERDRAYRLLERTHPLSEKE